MEEKVKEIDNHDLIQLYRLVLEHLEYLEVEKKKVLEDDSK